MTSTPKVTAVHGALAAAAITTAAFEESFPAARVRHLLDSSLNDDLDGTQVTRERLERRLVDLIRTAGGSESTAILVTCSSYARLVDEFLPGAPLWLGVPVIRPDTGMYSEVRASGAACIGVLASLPDAAEAALYGLAAAYESENVEIHVHVVDRTANDPGLALARGAVDLVAQHNVEAIALAQYSLTPAAARITREVSLPVFTGPAAAVRMMRELVADRSDRGRGPDNAEP